MNRVYLVRFDSTCRIVGVHATEKSAQEDADTWNGKHSDMPVHVLELCIPFP